MAVLKWNEPSEKDIETAILYFLNYQEGCFAFKINTVGIYDHRGGFYRKPNKFQLSGTPDVICCMNLGGPTGLPVFVGFEVKTPKGRQTNDQKEFQERLESKSNGFYFIVKSIKDVEDAIASVKEKLTTVYNQIS